MEIRIYDSSLRRITQIDNFNHLIWHRKFTETGDFELLAPLSKENRQIFTPGRLVCKAGSEEAGVIESLVIKEGDENTIEVKGRFLESYMERTLIKETFNFSGPTERAMFALAQKVENVPGLELSSLKNFPEKVKFQATMKPVYSTISKLSKGSAIGFRIRPDFKAKKMWFETFKGTDRTVNKRGVQFSEGNENINKAEYVYNEQNYHNVAIVGGEGEGTARIYVVVGEGTGLDRREVFVDAKDLRKEEGMTDQEYKELLTERGEEKLAEFRTCESVELETLAEGNFIYKKDYDLGDLITVKKESWGIEIKQRITAIDEIYENGYVTVIPTVGDALPETIEWGE